MFKSIRIRNFRSIKEATFKPAESGITSILGSTGAGKSTILTATLFALYGVRPDRVTQKSLRRDGASTKDECSVSVLFTHMGDEIEIIRELKGAAATTTANIYVNGIEQTHTTPTSATAWMRERLGVDADGFLTAFVVRQKELEDIVSAVPSKRKEQIEKLAGIDTLGDALKKAREAEKDTNKLLESIPGSKESMEAAEAVLAEQKSTSADFIEQYRAAEQLAESSRTEALSISEELRVLQTLKDTLSQVRNNISNLERMIANTDNLNKSVKHAAEVDESFNLEDLRAKHKELYQKEVSQRQERDSLIALEAQQQATILQQTALVNNFSRPPAELVNLDREALTAQAAELTDAAVQKQQARALALSRRNDLMESISYLGHASECPTCHRDLSDKDELIARFHASAEEFAEEAAAAEQAISELSEQHTAVTQQLELNMRAVAAEAEYEQLVTALKSSHESLVSLDKVPDMDAALEDLQAKLQESTERGLKLKSISEDHATYKRTTEELVSYRKQLEEQRQHAAKLESEYNAERDMQLTSSYEKAMRDQKEADYQIRAMNEQKQETDKRIAIAESTLRHAGEQWKMKQEVLQKAEKQALTRDIIEKYRLNIISALAPELSETASVLISDMTSGAFINVNIDEEFNITAETRQGEERKVSELSGGEEAAVALALRLAIASLITGGMQNVAWLDEVLTAQDPDRRASMLATIRGLDIRQIIMINHTQEAADIADHIVTMDQGVLYEAGEVVPVSKEEEAGDTEVTDGGVLSDWELLADD